MMHAPKQLLTTVMLLLLLPAIVAAQGQQRDNYNDVSSLTIDFGISSSLLLDYVGEPKTIDYIKADLSFFPQDSTRQTVKIFKPYSSPNANIKELETSVVYTWGSTQQQKLTYGVDSEITIKNIIPPIKKKISFPLTKIDSSFHKYTQATQFIDINTAIEQQAQEIIGAENDYYHAVYKLAEWTRQNINYNLTTLTAEVVQPSSWVLKNGEGVCDEIANLFISLSRSVGIPARFVSGMVYSNVGYTWGAHGWAEVYFPEYGWVPFDVTFGEYGWIDPSHLKLKDNVDSGSPTTQYTWKTAGVDIDIQELHLDTQITNIGQAQPAAIGLEIIPLHNTANFDSYVPIEIKVQNLQDHYVAAKIIMTKAPQLLENNVKTVLLEPEETKSIHWIAHVKEDLDNSFVYTSTLEVKGMFGEMAQNILKYGSDYSHYTQAYAEAYLNRAEQREEKDTYKELSVNCEKDKELYYNLDNASITCEISNTGSKQELFDLCFAESCETHSLQRKQKITVTEKFPITGSQRVPVIIESVNKAQYIYINLESIPVPSIEVLNLQPENIDYRDKVTLTFDLESNTPVEKLYVDFGFDKLYYETFEGSNTITLNTHGSTLLKGLTFHVSYVDKNGKKYREAKAIKVAITNVPWYGNFFHWLQNLF